MHPWQGTCVSSPTLKQLRLCPFIWLPLLVYTIRTQAGHQREMNRLSLFRYYHVDEQMVSFHSALFQYCHQSHALLVSIQSTLSWVISSC